MILLDTNILIATTINDLGVLEKLARIARDGIAIGASTVAWAEFCNGPLSPEDRLRTETMLDDNFADFTEADARISAELFNLGGRRRGSNVDCMIAASAINRRSPLLTRNLTDFSRFESQGLQLEPLN